LKQYDLALADSDRAIELEDSALNHATKAEILFGMGDADGMFKSLKIAVAKGIDPKILDAGIREKYGESQRYKEIVNG
jgi:hypothetical protein